VVGGGGNGGNGNNGQEQNSKFRIPQLTEVVVVVVARSSTLPFPRHKRRGFLIYGMVSVWLGGFGCVPGASLLPISFCLFNSVSQNAEYETRKRMFDTSAFRTSKQKASSIHQHTALALLPLPAESSAAFLGHHGFSGYPVYQLKFSTWLKGWSAGSMLCDASTRRHLDQRLQAQELLCASEHLHKWISQK